VLATARVSKNGTRAARGGMPSQKTLRFQAFMRQKV
jgi:hypothetical protein